VVVPPEIQYTVNIELEREAKEKLEKEKREKDREHDKSQGPSRHSSSDKGKSRTKDTSSPASPTPATHGSETLTKPPSRVSSPAYASPFVGPYLAPFPPLPSAEELDRIPSVMIQDPHKANHIESLYLSHIAKQLETEGPEGPKVAKAWTSWCKFFNGQHALEKIPVREGIKRKELWRMLTAMEDFLIVVRHW
jgi:hypothetical protein